MISTSSCGIQQQYVQNKSFTIVNFKKKKISAINSMGSISQCINAPMFKVQATYFYSVRAAVLSAPSNDISETFYLLSTYK